MARQDESVYEPEKLILFRFAIDNELILYHEQLTSTSFVNMVFVGSRVGAFLWTENFINHYQQYLPVDNRELVVSLAKAALAFYQKEWQKARYLINPIYFKEDSFELVRRSLLLRTLYEIYVETKVDDTSLSSHADTFIHFLTRKSKLQKSKKQPYRNLVRFTLRLLKLHNNPTPAAIQRLFREVIACKHLSFKHWILDHLEKINPENKVSRVHITSDKQ